MMRSFVVLLVLFISLFANAQEGTKAPEVWREGYVVKDASADTLSHVERIKAQRIRSENALRALKDKGSIIVRLKTNDRSIDAYRAAGKIDIASRMEMERRVMNKKIFEAFSRIVTFCPVHFIYAKDTRDFQAGKKVLLNAEMEYDSTIILTDTFYIFAEHGTAATNPYIMETGTGVIVSGSSYRPRRFLGSDKVSSYASSSASEAAIVFMDKNIQQYFDPFPYCEGVYMENYNLAATYVNKQLYRSYTSLVAVPDMKYERKKSRKEAKAKLKAQ